MNPSQDESNQPEWKKLLDYGKFFSNRGNLIRSFSKYGGANLSEAERKVAKFCFDRQNKMHSVSKEERAQWDLEEAKKWSDSFHPAKWSQDERDLFTQQELGFFQREFNEKFGPFYKIYNDIKAGSSQFPQGTGEAGSSENPGKRGGGSMSYFEYKRSEEAFSSISNIDDQMEDLTTQIAWIEGITAFVSSSVLGATVTLVVFVVVGIGTIKLDQAALCLEKTAPEKVPSIKVCRFLLATGCTAASTIAALNVATNLVSGQPLYRKNDFFQKYDLAPIFQNTPSFLVPATKWVWYFMNVVTLPIFACFILHQGRLWYVKKISTTDALTLAGYVLGSYTGSVLYRIWLKKSEDDAFPKEINTFFSELLPKLMDKISSYTNVDDNFKSDLGDNPKPDLDTTQKRYELNFIDYFLQTGI